MTIIDTFINSYKLDKNVCDHYIDYFNNSDNTFTATAVVKNEDKALVSITDETITRRSITQIDYDSEDMDPYYESVWEFHEHYFNRHSVLDKSLGFGPREMWQISKYNEGDHWNSWHYDRMQADGKLAARLLTYFTFLSDGVGDLEFMYQKKTIKAEAGLTLIFPSDWTHAWKIHPAVNGGYTMHGLMSYYD
jgi:prolyl 4-hydroxylase